jgi:hypothetical protein
MRSVGSSLARYTADSIEWPGDGPKVLAPMAAGDWDQVTKEAYMRMEIRSNHVDRN